MLCGLLLVVSFSLLLCLIFSLGLRWITCVWVDWCLVTLVGLIGLVCFDCGFALGCFVVFSGYWLVWVGFA